MKKYLLLFLMISFVAVTYSQSRVLISKSQQDVVKTKEFKKGKEEGSSIVTQTPPMVYNPNLAPIETDLMITKYDLYTNSMLSNRFTMFDDGTMAAVNTRGILPDGTYPDRGTGYNYFNGTAWMPIPTQRIETAKTGWPTIAQFGDGEVVVAHLASGVRVSSRPVKGTGAWEEFTFFGPSGIPDLSWPRMASGGENHNTLHLFTNSYDSYNGQTQALIYSRSFDGCQTFDPAHVVLDGVGPDYYTEISADDYAVAVKGNNVVVLVASPFYDMFIMKSTDNGESWEKKLIWEHPYPMWDWNTTLTTDTLYAQDNSANVALDQYGNAHVVFGISRIMHTAAGTTYNFFPGTDGIGYWNEYMEQIPEHPDNPHKTLMPEYLDEMGMLIGWTQDVNNNGTIDFLDDLFSYRELGISTMPTLVIDDNNVIYLAYSSTTEGFDNSINNYKHIWMRTSPDLGTTWGDFVDITSDIAHIFDECIMPQLCDGTQENHVNLWYCVDFQPGLALDADHDPVENRVINAKVPKGDIVAIEETELFAPPVVSQNFPNPANSIAEITVNLKQSGNVSIDVYNLVGQKVYEISPALMSRGANKLTLDVSSLKAGIYLYKVNIDDESHSLKMIVE